MTRASKVLPLLLMACLFVMTVGGRSFAEEEGTIIIHRSSPKEPILKAEITFCTEITGKECADPANMFPLSAGKIYCHTTITGANSYIEVKHQWIHEGKVIQTIRLPVKSSRWRTWSVKTLEKSFVGKWTVKVFAGDLLIGEGSFQVTE